jgi:hypothetical protein
MEQDRRKNDSEMRDLIEQLSTQIYNKVAEVSHSTPSPKTVEMFNSLDKKIDGIHSALYGFENEGGLIKKISSIEEQTKKTNGRVNSLEGWKAYITGGIAVIVLIGLPIMLGLIADVQRIQASQIIQQK